MVTNIANIDLTKWIYEHKVCWELSPYFAIVAEDRKEQIGFELDLFAQHSDRTDINPGCRKCEELYAGLQHIAISVLPHEKRPTAYEIEPFDAAFHLRLETKMKTEVQLKIVIRHHSDVLRPLDECEQKCCREIRLNLERLAFRESYGMREG